MSSRHPCLVPFCRRTKKPAPRDAALIGLGYTYEWICAVHWRAVPREIRRTFHRARRLNRRALEEMCWRRCKASAIERAMGV